MALADIPKPGQPRRLDSWKEIAEYLGRDVRTATRWEAQGLPLHRIPGGRGRSVFAFTEEIDAWMAGRDKGAAVSSGSASPDVVGPPAWPLSMRARAVAAVAALLITVAAGVAMIPPRWRKPLDASALRVAVTETEVSVREGTAVPIVIHSFGRGLARQLSGRPPVVSDSDGNGRLDLLFAVSVYEDRTDGSVRSGELLNMELDGSMRWKFSFDDVLAFRDEEFSGPWGIADWQAVGRGPRTRVAVAAHDYVWWASMVGIVDAEGRRLSTFVHPGWVESVMWLDSGRLAMGGFNNQRDEAMFAILEGDATGWQAPGTSGSPFACTDCPSAVPRFYATLPRSELNRITGERFNRATVTLIGDRIHVTTTEMHETAANAIYEFNRDAQLLSARFSGAYWDVHRRLEHEGRLKHTRAACPDRDGPAAIQVWSPAGWRRIPAPH